MPKIKISRIIVAEDRQRKEFGDIPELAESILQHGLLQPVVLNKAGLEYTLVAGERRLRAHLHLGLTEIEYKEFKDLSPVELKILEYEENVRRKDLSWQERVKAIAGIHALRKELDPTWTQEQTATEVGYAAGKGEVTQALVVVEYLDDPRIKQATSGRQAYNEVVRRQQRQLQDIANEILTPAKPKPKAQAPSDDSTSAPEIFLDPTPKAQAVLNGSFLDWAPTYEGERFNLIHCDFPYGVDLQNSAQMGQHQKLYEDSEDTYWKLLDCFAEHIDRFAYPSCHLIFWYAPKFERETRDFFAKYLDSFVMQDIPLVWLKTDNRGILADPKRRPRNITEFAMLGSRGDRQLVKAKSNGYPGPSSSSKQHPSEKPEPMLKHFMEMLVNEQSRVFDPTCGAGSSLRAADALGAEAVFGIELDADFAQAAESSLNLSRNLRLASAALG
jgi:ParB/RepB/Spo0J family partition protein